MNIEPQPLPKAFADLGVLPAILQNLAQRKLETPTPIQHQAIPPAIQGKDVIGIAQTGTGKTLAFGIPMIQRLSQGPGRALILVPTRELAYQVDESLSRMAQAFGIRTAVFVGGASMRLQLDMIRRNPRILIATPGRLNDHLEQRTVTLKEVSILVLDEADRMLDMGFKPQIERILKHVPLERQTMLFSATMAQEIVKLANQHMKTPLRIEVAPAGTAAEKVEQEIFIVRKDEKLQLLEALLTEYKGTVLVFSRTKHGARKMTKALRAMGHTAAEIHADRTLAQRKEALEGFKRGTYRILVATDIAARGIHVTGIEVVVNYDIPDDPADYVHRIGRTARAGMEGRAISFVSPDQVNDIRHIEKLIRRPLPRKQLPTLPPARATPKQPSGGHHDDADHKPLPFHQSGHSQAAPRRHSHGGRIGGGGHKGGPRGGQRFRRRPR
jgi:ATP-dependent RNA helicase RhlE